MGGGEATTKPEPLHHGGCLAECKCWNRGYEVGNSVGYNDGYGDGADETAQDYDKQISELAESNEDILSLLDDIVMIAGFGPFHGAGGGTCTLAANRLVYTAPTNTAHDRLRLIRDALRDSRIYRNTGNLNL